MPKFVFFLCAFLLAGAVCADDVGTQTNPEEVTPTYVQNIAQSLLDMINGLIRKVDDAIQEAAQKTSENGQKLKDEAINIAKSVYNNIVSVQKAVKSEVQQMINEAIDVNVTECAEMADAFDHAGVQALSEVTRCVTDIIEEADGYNENIMESSRNVVKNLTNIKDEAQVCIKDIDGITSSAKAYICVSASAAKGTWVASKQVPSLLLNVGKLTYEVLTLLPKLTLCSNVKGVKEVKNSSSEIVQKVKECIEAQKALQDSKKSQ